MWKIIICLFIAVSYFGCDIINPASKNVLMTEFEIKNADNVQSNIFRKDEAFHVYYRIINFTGTEQEYGYGYPAVYFEIIKNDTIYLTSVDGCAFPQPYLKNHLQPGDTLKAFWRGPQPDCIDEEQFLQPGDYYINVRSGFYFKEYGILQTDMIAIQIIQ